MSEASATIKVLVVDDDIDLSQLISMTLRSRGMRVVTAHDGISAVEEARRLRPDVAILDVGLPHFDGHSLGEHLRSLQEGPRPRLIAITADGREATKRRSTEAGFDAHFVKPPDADSLADLVLELAGTG